MRKIIFLLLISCSAYCQNATIIYKDSTIRTKIKDYDYDGLDTKFKFMKWDDVKKITFESKQSVSMTMVKNLNHYTNISFINEGEELPKQNGGAVAVMPPVKHKQVISEQQFVDKVMTFDEYYENNILPFKESSQRAKSAMLWGMGFTIIGSIVAGTAKNNESGQQTAGSVAIAIGGITFLGGMIGDMVALDKLKKPKVPR